MPRPVNNPPQTLKYSTLTEVPNAERESERDRREQVENYNLTTYGDRRPILADLLRMAVVILILGIVGGVSILLLPSWAAELVTSIGALAFVIWRRVRQIG